MFASKYYPVMGFLELITAKHQRGLEMAETPTTDRWKQNLPDIYFDRIQLTTTVLGVTMVITLTDPIATIDPSDKSRATLAGTDMAIIRTSTAHAKLISMLIKKQLKQYEEKSNTEIQIPEDVYKELGLKSTDW